MPIPALPCLFPAVRSYLPISLSSSLFSLAFLPSAPCLSSSLPASLCLFLWSMVMGLRRCRIQFRTSGPWENVLGKRGPEGLSTYQRHISLWVVNFLFRQPFSSPEAQLKLTSCGLGKSPGSRAYIRTSSLTFNPLEPPVLRPPCFCILTLMFLSQEVLGHHVLTTGA